MPEERCHRRGGEGGRGGGGGGGGGAVMLSSPGALLAPELPHLFPAPLHETLVLGDPQLLSVDDAGPLGSGPVPVVRVLLHVELGELGLLLVVALLVSVGHGLPASA